MKVGIVASIKNSYFNEINYVLDKNWISFLDKVFENYNLEIINEKTKNFNHDIIILTGGNDSLKFSRKKTDIIRNKLDNIVIKNCIKKKIKLIGICWGAIKINEYFNGRTAKIKNHVRKFHNIYGHSDLENKKFNLTLKVNSYHNYQLKKLGKDLIGCMKCIKDNSIEMFIHKKKDIIGIMWHPERHKIYNNFDKKLFKVK
tara:strand:- start:1378 stop:1980 length:603 start_codon:yes stop_codon:yes gene_type:complete